MPRPSKNVHLLATLRQELNLHQVELAERVGVSDRTIRKVELGAQKLSYRLAEAIGDTFDLDPQSLIRNDLSKGLITWDGRPWDRKKRREIQARLRRWGDLEPYARQAQRGITAALLYQYLEISDLIRHMPDPEIRLIEWVLLFQLAKNALIFSQPPVFGPYKEPSSGSLDTVLDDIQAVRSDLRLIQRVEKRQAKQLPEVQEKYRLKFSMARHFGWNDRALVAAKVVEELGGEKTGKMPFVDFVQLVHDRCKAEGVPVPEYFDAFDAVVAWQGWYKSRIRKAVKK